MVRDQLNRRNFVRGVGAVTIAGGLAGCSGGGDGGGSGDGGDGGSGGGDGDGGGEETPEPTEAPAETTESGGGDGGGGSVPSEVSDYLSNVGNFDGTVVDETGTGNVNVEVGAEGNGGAFAFAPAAVRIDAGTDVNWSWTGNGGQHNVVDEDGNFESSLTSQSGNDFQHTFEEAGVYLYYCSPHKSLGMKGAIIVE